MRRLLTVLFSSMVLVGVLATQAWAPAPRGSIQYVGLVLKKLDPTQPPTYVNEFFSPAPAPGEPGGRELLTDDVADAARVMNRRDVGAGTAAAGLREPGARDQVDPARGARADRPRRWLS